MTVLVLAKNILIEERYQLPLANICQLIKFILKNNVTSFNDEYFLQVCGTAMGTRMSPCNAKIFMAE